MEIRLTERLRFLLQGRIDRVDAVAVSGGVGEYEIWDYKTGSTFGYDAGDLLAEGVRLQWVLYAYALEEMARGSRVRQSGYFFAGDRGLGRRFDAVPPDPQELGALLEPLFEMVAQGAFLHVQKGLSAAPGLRMHDHCTFCDFRRVCASERKSERDLADMCDATSQMRTFAQELARMEEQGVQEGSRGSIRAYLDEAGIAPEDLVPPAVADSAGRWMSGLQQEMRYGPGPRRKVEEEA